METGTGTFVSAANTGSNPLTADSDTDTFPDGQEVLHNSNPNLAAATPSETRGPIVFLNATNAPPGELAPWANQGILGGTFTPSGPAGLVTAYDGINGLVFDASSTYVGPPAPAFIAGNGARSVDAWIFNPTMANEETLVAWGRRGGPDGSNFSFNHGLDAVFGAVGQWGAGPDIGWNNVFSANIWTHIAYSYDPATNTTAVYRDGILANSEVNGPINTWSLDTLNRPLALLIGGQNEGDGSLNTGLRATMTIASVRIFDRAVPASELSQRYSTEAGAFRPSISSTQYNSTTGELTITWDASAPAPGRTYALMESTDLLTWAEVTAGLTTGTHTFPAPNPLGAKNFYRIELR